MGLVTGHYDRSLVALSVLIAITASYAGLDLGGRVTHSRGWIKTAWLWGGSLAMGLGIWSMHYVGMMAVNLPIVVTYDWPMVLLSFLAAFAASWLALFIVEKGLLTSTRVTTGSVLMGGGISAMHYIGMAAIRTPVVHVYNPSLVALSIAMAVGISWVALRFTFAFRATVSHWSWTKTAAAFSMGIAIAEMHYVGMDAASFSIAPQSAQGLNHVVNLSTLALVGVVVVTLFSLAIVILTAIIDRRFSFQSELLAESQDRLQAVFENMAEGIVVLDRSQNLVAANPAAIRMLHLPRERVTLSQVNTMLEVAFPDGTPLSLDQLPGARAFRGDFLDDCKLRITHRSSGSTIMVGISTRAVSTRNHQPSEILISYRDITEQEQINDAVTRLAAIVSSSDDAIIGKDEGGTVLTWNGGAERIFGYSAPEMVGQSIRKLLPADRQNEEDDILDRIQRGETVDHFETQRIKKSGDIIHVSLTISPILDSHGRVIGASKIARDITNTKLLQRQLQQSQKLEAIGQLTDGIAHDFNNLLGVIVGNLDLLERFVSGSPEALKRIQSAIRAANRGSDLTKRLLTFSRNDNLLPAPTKVDESIRNTIELATRVIGPEVTIHAHCDASVPEVLVDATALESALLNLMVNARDAMPRGGKITLSAQLKVISDNHPLVRSGELNVGQFACISLTDTGTGMSREVLDRAFEPFFTTKERGKGTGLGLAMVYGFAKQSGGGARLYSELGVGTTVSLYLPLAERSVQAPMTSHTAHERKTDPAKVLVVDDEEDLLELTQLYLADLGHVAFAAKNGIAALEVIEREPDLDLLVTDILMPGGMTGVELAERARKMRPDIRVVYTSGFPADALGERKENAPVGILLRKPFQRSEFAAVLNECLAGSTGGH